MSGIKCAEVKHTLDRTLASVRSTIEEYGSLASATADVGSGVFFRKQMSAESAHNNLIRKLPDEIKKYVGDEAGKWQLIINSHDTAFKEAGNLSKQADARMSSYEALRRKSDSDIYELQRRAQAIRASLAGKSGYCDAENEQAKHLRSAANGVLAKLRSDMSVTQEAQRLRQASFSKLSEAESLAKAAQREYDRLVTLAANRKEQERIAEENRRKALALKEDIASLRGGIETKNYQKFANGSYSAIEVEHEVTQIDNFISKGNYESACNFADKVKRRLIDISDSIDSAQLVWETAKAFAEKLLSDAREECMGMSKEDLKTYSGVDASTIDSTFATIDLAADTIIKEEFADASKMIEDTMKIIRAIGEKATENKKKAQEREEIAQAIMQALYDAAFDTPEYYLDDEGNALSDLHVIAAAPGEVGDMSLQIDLAGKTSFEVKNIPEGHEQLCIEQIQNLQKNLAESGICFDMTDWGRAKNLAKINVNVGENGKIQEKDITMQRQG